MEQRCYYDYCFVGKGPANVSVNGNTWRMVLAQQNTSFSETKKESGFTMAELAIVVLIIAIIVVTALPQIISSRRLFMFSAVKREMTSHLREARQKAMSERKPVTFRYDNSTKRITLYGGTLGAAGSSTNRNLDLSGMGVARNDIVYGRPSGVSAAPLGDGTNLTALTANQVEITFQSDGSVLDASDNPENHALFLYHAVHPTDTAFALSILGAGGRVKVWRYSAGVNQYVE